MFHNYFFLRRLADELHQSLTGMSLMECFSQSKDELIMGFADQNHILYLRANLNSQVCLLQIADDFKRARKNSVDLFTELIDLKVTKVEVFRFERSFTIYFGNGPSLLFKMHSSRSNILLTEENKVTAIFRNNLPNDLSLTPSELDKNFEVSFERFETLNGDVREFLPALGKEVNQYLISQSYPTLSMPDQWALLSRVMEAISTNPIRIYRYNGLPVLSLFSLEAELLLETTSAIEACTRFYEYYTREYYLHAERQQSLKPLDEDIKKTTSYLEKTRQKLEEIKARRGYGEIANILMANLHQIPRGSQSATLEDFYTGQDITIKLNPGLSPQKNAENLYRKSKNQQMEINKLEENLRIRQTKLDELLTHRDQLAQAHNIKEVRAMQPTSKEKKVQEVILPYHEYQYGGYTIMVGKHAKANDELTLKIATKNDLWLHAKDVAGSHVVIRHQAGKNFPKDVIEHAAQLAAWFSKRKTDSLCPVIYTPKKYVRKRKGTPPGAVVVEKEAIIMVEPKNF